MCRLEGEQVASGGLDKQDNQASIINEVECNLASLTSDSQVFMQIVRVKLRNGSEEIIVRTLFDLGSQRSYITKTAASQMGYEYVDQQQMRHLLFGGEQTSSVMVILGIKDPIAQKTQKQQQEDTNDRFLTTVNRISEVRCEVELPWLETHPPLGDNKTIAIRRLQTLVKKLQVDGHYSAYNDIIREWLQDGIIEEIPSGKEDNFGHYLPHRHVIKENSTTVIRPVFDASAKEAQHPALNECLENGINLIEHIPSILLRFREGSIRVISDIRRASLQISVNAMDRDFMRFLWIDESGNIIYFRHCRVVFGVCCSPFILAAVLNLHLKNILQ